MEKKPIDQYTLQELKALAFDLRNDLEVVMQLINKKMQEPEIVPLEKK
jgi:hypothetical protein